MMQPTKALVVAAVALLAGCVASTAVVAPAELPTPTTAAIGQPTSHPTPASTATAPPLAGPTAAPAPTAAPTPTPLPTPAPTPIVLDPPAQPGKFTMDLYKPKAHVRQGNNSMCVPASMQIMLNLMRPELDRTREWQDQLYAIARSYSPWLTEARGGASGRGWAAGLDQLGYGDFDLAAEASMDEALETAARQMRFTGKPVGLLVWRGDHAWVMSGFKATADPAWTTEFDVTAVWIEDPWYGRTDRTWGAGLAPHTLVSLDEMRDDYVSWTSRHLSRIYGVERYYMVLPLS